MVESASCQNQLQKENKMTDDFIKKPDATVRMKTNKDADKMCCLNFH